MCGIALLLLGALAAPTVAALEPAGDSRQAERLFARGVTAYAADDWDVARGRFQAVVDLPPNQRSRAALLMLGRVLLRLEEYSAAVDAARRLLREAPDGLYAADASLVAGDAYHALKRYYEAATEYARILAGDGPLPVKASAAERLAAIARNHSITDAALAGIRQQLGADRLRDALLYGEARWYRRLGWVELSRARLAAYLDSVGSTGAFYDLARRQVVRVESRDRGPSGRRSVAASAGERTGVRPQEQVTGWTPAAGRQGVPRLGVLVPLQGRDRDIGGDLLAGVRLANEELGEPFDIVVVDTGTEYTDADGEPIPIFQSDGDRLIRVVAGTRFLVDEAGVLAIIGPVFSTSCAAAAGVAEAAGVPLIAPLAQQSGLDTLGRHLFQLSPIPEVQGRTLAEYATLVLGLETLAILSPLSDDGYAFEQAFASTAASNGGRIVYSDWYYPGETRDFHQQFENLRRVGFSLQPAPDAADTLAVFDSLEVALLDTTFEGEWTFEALVEATGVLDGGEAPDSSEMFIDTIDGVAVIAEHFDDARTIAPQLRFHRLQTQLLGNDAWYDPEGIVELSPTEREHLKGCVFVARLQGSEAEQAFVDRYRTRTGRDPRYAASGYDAAHLVGSGWLAGHRSRSDLRQYLADLRGYEGASGRLSFAGGRRVNSELALLKIDDRGRVRPLQAGDLPALAPQLPAAEDLPLEDLWEEREPPPRDPGGAEGGRGGG